MQHPVSTPSHFTVATADEGIRLDKWLKTYYPLPYSLVQKLLRKGAIRVDGKRAKGETRLSPGQMIKIPLVEAGTAKEAKRVEVLPEDIHKHITAQVLFENDAYLVINKRPGIPTQGGTGVKQSVDLLLKVMGKGAVKTEAAHAPIYKLTHRLDKDTSGVLLIAKHREAAKVATEAFKTRDFKKTYWALIAGVPSVRDGTIAIKLSEADDSGKQERTVPDETNGKRAVTHYRVVETAGKKMCWVEIEPETGRKHQIRAHFTAIGHPVVGDGKYGGQDAMIEGISKNLHLHARHLHHSDLLGATLDVSAPLPTHMQATWELLEWDKNNSGK